jgi:hypothetical protein
VISVADYRFSRNDIGIVKDGRVDLRARVSNDNGATWEDITTVIAGKGKDSPEKSGFMVQRMQPYFELSKIFTISLLS